MKAILYVGLPVLLIFSIIAGLIFLGYQGMMYWIDVTRRSAAQGREVLELDNIAVVDIYYPNAIRLDSGIEKDLTIELMPLETLTEPLTITVQLQESSPYIALGEYRLEMPAMPHSPQSNTVKVIPHDLGSPPPSVRMSVEAKAADPQLSQVAEIRIPIDNWTWRVGAAAGIFAGFVSLLLALLGILGAIRTLA